MRFLLFALTAAMTCGLALWGVDMSRPDAISAHRTAWLVAVLSSWCPLVLATWYAFRCADLQRRLKPRVRAEWLRRGRS